MAIIEALKDLKKSNMYPFHMPGHKRKALEDSVFPYDYDITEIDGFDDLHEPEGILLEAQQKAARLYGAEESFYLVNGSTCGILASICAAVPMNGTILVARNCHKAVYHAIMLRNAKAIYLYPEIDAEGIASAITPDMVSAKLKQLQSQNINVDAAILTSPTYEGVVSDIKGIAEILHEANVPLIVDAAHGAHFGMHESFPENPLKLGADAVIVSIHKTLPAPTQTALLHLCGGDGNRIDRGKIKYFLDVFETSSPSYVLMAAMEQAIDYCANHSEAFATYAKRLDAFYHSFQGEKALKHLKICQFDDPSKIVIIGRGLADKLRKDFSIEVEMESKEYVILMTSVMDTDEGFMRLCEALLAIDAELSHKNVRIENNASKQVGRTIENRQASTIAEAMEADAVSIPLQEAAGKVAAEFLYLYPPGIPLLVPGEEVTADCLAYLRDCEADGLKIKGTEKPGKIKVLIEK